MKGFSFDSFSKYLLCSMLGTQVGRTVLLTDSLEVTVFQVRQLTLTLEHHGGLLLNQMIGEQCSSLRNQERLQREIGIQSFNMDHQGWLEFLSVDDRVNVNN